jgi:hypothetical protein
MQPLRMQPLRMQPLRMQPHKANYRAMKSPHCCRWWPMNPLTPKQILRYLRTLRVVVTAKKPWPVMMR